MRKDRSVRSLLRFIGTLFYSKGALHIEIYLSADAIITRDKDGRSSFIRKLQMVPKQRAVVAHYREKVPSEETQMPRSAQDYKESSELNLLKDLLGGNQSAESKVIRGGKGFRIQKGFSPNY
ncbi:hypothetical protein CDAR_250271 [Caerostris darwini]|uniref:Uncharacterized protein n=1 Tax=Caerostris darwini TaxID=1538125 RepID=A0AAV4QFP3_9ARAC|nr:hypothetical protein CDAR_250271 [Caerostris darwini]